MALPPSLLRPALSRVGQSCSLAACHNVPRRLLASSAAAEPDKKKKTITFEDKALQNQDKAAKMKPSTAPKAYVSPLQFPGKICSSEPDTNTLSPADNGLDFR
jgi:hypothetical protein